MELVTCVSPAAGAVSSADLLLRSHSPPEQVNTSSVMMSRTVAEPLRSDACFGRRVADLDLAVQIDIREGLGKAEHLERKASAVRHSVFQNLDCFVVWMRAHRGN